MKRTCAGWHREPNDGQPPPYCGHPHCHSANHQTWPIPGVPVWCNHHHTAIRNALLELPDLYVQLHLEATHGTAKPTNDRVSGSKHEPSPAPRIDDADQLARWACDWEDTLRQDIGDPAAPHVTSSRPPALSEATRYLVSRLPRILALDDATDEPIALMFGEDVLNTHRKLTRRVGWDRLTHKLPAPCPSCDTRALRRQDGDDRILCANCERIWTEDEYSRLVLILAAELETA